MVQSYIAWNTSTNVAVEDNQGEMILLHGGRGAFAEVASNAGTTLTIRTDGLIDGQPLMIYDQTAFTNVPDTVMYGPLDNRAYVLIGGGQGLGQARHIVSHTPTTISVDKSWRVPPAAGSKIAVLYLYRDIVQYRNELNAYPEGYLQSNQTASCGVDYDGNCFGCVAEGNVSRHTHTARNICASGVSQSYWNEMRSETALATSHSADALVCWFNYYAPVEDKFNAIGPFLLGNAFRGGSREVAGPWFDGSSTHLLGAPAQEHADACGRRRLTAGNVFEGTTAWGAIRGVHAGPLTDTLFRKVGLTLTNVTGRVPPYPDTPQPVYQQGGSVALLSGNRYAGAPTNYHGDGMFVPGPLPVPLHRVARFVGQVSQPLPDVIVPFANAGTRAADWSAETPDPRITAQVLDTPLAPEAIGRARVAVDAVTLTRGTHWSQVILSSAATSVVVGVRVELSDPASNAPAGPTAAFAADPTTGLAPLPVQFRNLSSAGSSFVSAWQWDCDADGAPDSGEREPLWQYATAATYSVRLTVRTGLTNSTLTRTNYVTVLARDAVTNRLPYAESFESQPPGSTLVGVQGWAAGDRAAALVATDRTVNAYRGPLPMAAAHQQLLRTQGRLDNRFAGTDGITNVTLDLMARLPRWTNGVPPLDSDDALALFTDGQGRLRLYHGVDAGGGSYSNVLTPLGSDPIGTDEWARLTLTLDYLSGAPRRFGQVQLHGRRAFTDALAFAAPTNLVHPGSWFLCANQGAVPARFGAVEFGGRVAVEDLVVTNGLLNLLNWKVAASASPETAGGIRPSGTFYVAHAGLTNFTLSPSNYWVGTFVVNGLTNAATNTLTLAVTNDLSVAGVFDWLRATNRVPVWWLAGHGWGGNWDDWALRDDDGDGVPSWMEYFADTDPTNRLSLLEMLGIRLTGGVVRLEWQGGTGAWQYVEWAGGLSPTGTSWQALWTNAPPTPRSNVLVRAGVTNPASLYRLRAERP
jgi:PKD repeat protein